MPSVERSTERQAINKTGILFYYVHNIVGFYQTLRDLETLTTFMYLNHLYVLKLSQQRQEKYPSI